MSSHPSQLPVSDSDSEMPNADIGASKCADYGNIPPEHHWRYDRYLADLPKKPKGPDAWYKAAQQVWANNKSGNTFEQEVRTYLGTPIGRGSKPVNIDGFVPDLPVGADYGVADVKNWVELTDSPQLRAFHKYATENSLPFNLIIGPNTKTISGPLLDKVRGTGGMVQCYDPASGEMTMIDIGSSGSWRKNS